MTNSANIRFDPFDDLRHLFATRCIESRVDIPTVSRWLGHSDGGALAMRVYGHLRNSHSIEMAQQVSFSKPAMSLVPHPNQLCELDIANTISK